MATVDEIKIIVQAQVDDAIAKMNALNNVNRKNANTGLDLAKSIAGYTTGYALAVVAAQKVLSTVGDLVTTSIKLAAAQERIKMEFAVLTGSMEIGNKLFGQMNDLAAETPLQLDSITAAGKQLLSVGVPVDDITNKLRMLGDVAMGNPEKLDRLTSAFGQLRSKGVASMEQLNRFIEAGVPIMAELEKQTGRSGDEVFKMVSQGKIGYAEVNRALESLTGEGGLMHDMMAKVAQTAEGKFSTALDNARLKLADIGTNMLPLVTSALDAFNSAMDKGAENELLNNVITGRIKTYEDYASAVEVARKRVAVASQEENARTDPVSLIIARGQLDALEKMAPKYEKLAMLANAREKAEEQAAKAAADAIKVEADARATETFAYEGAMFARQQAYTAYYADKKEKDEEAVSVEIDGYTKMLEERKKAYEKYFAGLAEAEDKAAKDQIAKQEEVAQIIAGVMTDSFELLGEALAGSEDGWKKWQAAGIKAIADILEKWATAQILMGIGNLFGKDPIKGLGQIAAGTAGAIGAGVLNQAANEMVQTRSITTNTSVASNTGPTYVVTQNVAGSVISQTELGNFAAQATATASRGY